MAFTDFLTQKPNRLQADKQLSALWTEALSTGKILVWMIVDIDNFKKINDSYGQPFGDICLKLVADTLASYSQKMGGFLHVMMVRNVYLSKFLIRQLKFINLLKD